MPRTKTDHWEPMETSRPGRLQIVPDGRKYTSTTGFAVCLDFIVKHIIGAQLPNQPNKEDHYEEQKRSIQNCDVPGNIRRAWFKLSEIEDPRILLFIDAAFACHNDAKSHIWGIRQEIEEGSIEMPHLPTGEILTNHAPNVPAKEINY